MELYTCGKRMNKISGPRSSQSSGRANQLWQRRSSPEARGKQDGRASETVLLEGTHWDDTGNLMGYPPSSHSECPWWVLP